MNAAIFEYPHRGSKAASARTLVIGLSCLSLLLGPGVASAGSREQAKRIHDRLNGTPPSLALLDAMQADIDAKNPVNAAYKAIENPNGNFYSIVLKNFATPWTNKDQTVFAPLNDYSATVIGMVRDDVPFNTALSADIIYTGKIAAGIPAYSTTGNDHYAQLEAQGVNLRDNLVRGIQSQVTGLDPATTAGVLTTRASARAFFQAGTNRRMFRFTMINHMCTDLQQVMDTSRPTDRIRQDVSRSPGGDSRIFLNNCVGCHSGMDPMAQAFAYYDYVFTTDEATGSIKYTNGVVVDKYFHNNTTFPAGFVTADDRWENRWRAGPNALMSWDPSLPGSGSGAKSLGAELGASDAFAQCQVRKVFTAICLRPPSDSADRTAFGSIVQDFKQGYSLKKVFAETAAYCSGD